VVIEESEPAFLYRLAKHLTRMVSDETIAIIIDEARTFQKKLNKGLQTFSDSGVKGNSGLIGGQTELEDKLNSQRLRQFKQRMSIKRQIRALTGKNPWTILIIASGWWEQQFSNDYPKSHVP